MKTRREWLWLLAFAICVGVLWGERRDSGNVQVQFERWESMEAGQSEKSRFAVISVYNQTGHTVFFSTLIKDGFWADLDWMGQPHAKVFFVGRGSGVDIEPGQKQVLGFRENAELRFFILPWSWEEADRAKARYANVPGIAKKWLLRKFNSVDPKYLYVVERPDPPPVETL
jgi:hypothetical protein